MVTYIRNVFFLYKYRIITRPKYTPQLLDNNKTQVCTIDTSKYEQNCCRKLIYIKWKIKCFTSVFKLYDVQILHLSTKVT